VQFTILPPIAVLVGTVFLAAIQAVTRLVATRPILRDGRSLLPLLAFEWLDLDLVAVSHDPDNEQSERAIRKDIEVHGGQREGHLRKTIAFQDESVHDEIRYSMTQEEYQMATD
jgi:hypothetical protein